MNRVVLKKKEGKVYQTDKYRAIVIFTDGSVHKQQHIDKNRIRRFIQLRCEFARVKYIDIMPPQNHNNANIKREAEKGGYNYDKYRKAFPVNASTTLAESVKRSQ